MRLLPLYAIFLAACARPHPPAERAPTSLSEHPIPVPSPKEASLACASRSTECEDLCMLRRSALACSRMAMWVAGSDPTKEFLFSARACEYGDPENCHVAGGKAGLGEGTPKSLERRVEFYERGCGFGSKECCIDAATALTLRPLSTTDPDGRLAEALFTRGGDFHAVAEIRSTRADHLCSPKVPEGEQGCVEALRAYREALTNDPTISEDRRDSSYGGKVNWACGWIRFEDCAKYPAAPKEEDPSAP